MAQTHALHFFGIDYLEQAEEKPFHQRNTMILWMHAYVDHLQELERQGKNAEIKRQVGVAAAWFRFAYDLFTIRDNAKVERRLKEGLLDNRHFQSARYELWVAALCITAGFDLDFEDETDTSNRHPEFIATDRYSSAMIAVEAKSRHRRGVQGFAEGVDVKPGNKVDIRGIVLDGYKKSSAFPLYIFVDVNLPPVEEVDVWQKWMQEDRCHYGGSGRGRLRRPLSGEHCVFQRSISLCGYGSNRKSFRPTLDAVL